MSGSDELFQHAIGNRMMEMRHTLVNANKRNRDIVWVRRLVGWSQCSIRRHCVFCFNGRCDGSCIFNWNPYGKLEMSMPTTAARERKHRTSKMIKDQCGLIRVISCTEKTPHECRMPKSGAKNNCAQGQLNFGVSVMAFVAANQIYAMHENTCAPGYRVNQWIGDFIIARNCICRLCDGTWIYGCQFRFVRFFAVAVPN